MIPPASPSRRRFLRTSALAAAGSALPMTSPLFAAAGTSDPLFKISLAEWSLHKRILHRDQSSEPALDHLDFAKTARALGIDGIEYVNQMFPDKARDKAYLAEMKSRAEGEGVASLLIMVDREGQLGDPDAARRAETVENHVKWLEAAAFLGCHSIRVNAGSKGTYEEQKKLAADGLHRLSEKGEQFGLNVIVENHGGLSSNGKWLVEVMKAADHPRCGTLPDFGNFYIDQKQGELYDPYTGVRELMPYAKAVSAKAYNWGDAKDRFVTTDDRAGREIELDFKKLLKIVIDAGYHGYIGIEHEGNKHSEMEGIARTKEVMELVRAELAAEARRA